VIIQKHPRSNRSSRWSAEREFSVFYCKKRSLWRRPRQELPKKTEKREKKQGKGEKLVYQRKG